MADQYGFGKIKDYDTQPYWGARKDFVYSFYRDTTDENVTYWVEKSENGYKASRSTLTLEIEPYEFNTVQLGEFKTAVEAKRWINKEFESVLI